MNLGKKIFSLFAIIVLLLPLYQPKKAYADTASGIALATKEFGLDAIAWYAANRVIKRIASQTVNWINNGFNGNPAYITDPGQFFLDTGDQVASRFLSDTALNKLCAPFKAEVRLALVKNYIYDDAQSYSCSLSILKNNYDNFVQDFSAGGWAGWFELTQNNQNNPFGAYSNAQNQLDLQVGSAIAERQNQLDWGRGFLSYEKCLGTTATNPSTGQQRCIGKTQTVTPGSVIEGQLNLVLGSGERRIEAADEIDEIIGALLDQLLSKAVGGIGGLFGANRPDASGRIFTDDLINDTSDSPQPNPYVTCTPDPNGGFPVCNNNLNPPTNTPGATCTPDASGVLHCYINGTNPGGPGGGGQCIGGVYDSALMGAMQNALQLDPTLANSLNTTANSYAFLSLVAQNPPSGYNVTDQVLNGNSNQNNGDLLAIWRSGDTSMERYDVIASVGAGDRTIAAAVQTIFTGNIPLNCTPTGGGTNCACTTTAPPGSTTPPGVPPPSPNPVRPNITSVTPTSVTPGVTTITIIGTNLQNALNGAVNVTFIDSVGRSTVDGRGGVNSSGTQVSVLVPNGLVGSTVALLIDNGTNLVSNSVSLQIVGGVGLQTTQPTFTWNPTQTSNGWWPRLSPDGRYVAYGNWGESWVTDLQTGQNYDLGTPADLANDPVHRCNAGQWITPLKVTYLCESSQLPVSNMYRYEASVGIWTPTRTADNTDYVDGNQFVARDGNWTTWSASRQRITQNNQIIANGVGGAMDASGSQIVHACDNNNTSICLRNGSTLTRTFTPQVPLHQAAMTNGYIVYGGYGPIRGITPFGTDINLRMSASFNEGGGKAAGLMNGSAAQVVTVGNQYWVASAADGQGNSYIFLRPWGSTTAIVISAPAVMSIDVVAVGSEFVIAYSTNVGQLTVLKVPINSVRSTIP